MASESPKSRQRLPDHANAWDKDANQDGIVKDLITPRFSTCCRLALLLSDQKTAILIWSQKTQSNDESLYLQM